MFKDELVFQDFIGFILSIIILSIVYYLANYLSKVFIDRKVKEKEEEGRRLKKKDLGIYRSGGLFLLIMFGVILITLILPWKDDFRKDIMSLIGVVLSAVLALSSATFIGNGLAGVMLRIINNFKPGDLIQVNEFFGKITERGLFHTELQTESSDLTTLPNMYLTINPVNVMRKSGTFITGTCSLGYDVNRQKIEKVLLDAADRAELKKSFVRVKELGDFSVVYTVSGKVENLKGVLTSQSRLNAMILDALHDANIEIVSPSFMNQRQVGDAVFIPKKMRTNLVEESAKISEDKVFDKADEVVLIEERKETLTEIEAKIKQYNEDLKNCNEEAKKEELEKEIERCLSIKARVQENIENKKDDLNSKG